MTLPVLLLAFALLALYSHAKSPLLCLILLEAAMVVLVGLSLHSGSLAGTLASASLALWLLVLGAGEGVVGIGLVMGSEQRTTAGRRDL